MNKDELTDFFNKVMLKLQKRDELLLDSRRQVSVGNETFSEYEIAFYIADIYSNQHSIPKKYLGYYLKTVDNSSDRPITLSSKRKQTIKNTLVDVKLNSRILAGGSLAKTYLVEDKDNNTVVIKSASGWPSNKLVNEIRYLDELNKYDEVSPHIPKVLDRKILDDSASLTLEYFPYNTLSYNILFSIINTNEVWRLTKSVLDFVSKDIWTKKSQTTPKNYVETFFLDRIENNVLKMLSQSNLFKNIVHEKTLVINGYKYFNLLEIVRQIRANRNIVEKLAPLNLLTIWGDLHPNNILIDGNAFVLIDPRGDLGDYLYDLGKIYHTYGPGRYDYIDNDLFVVKVTIDDGVKIKRRFFVKHPSWKTYNELRILFEKNITRYIKKNDKNWRLRWQFLKFCIYATMPLFLIKNDNVESRVLMGYSNAVILGNRFLKYMKKYE